MATEAKGFICDSCRKVDFRDLIRNRDQYDLDNPSPHSFQYSAGCQLCQHFYEMLSEKEQRSTTEDNSVYEIQSTSFGKRYGRVPRRLLPGDDSTMLYIFNRSTGFSSGRYSPHDTTSCRATEDESKGPCCIEAVSDLCDYDKARCWLDNCNQCHGSTCQQEPMSVPGMNLIDCENMVIVKATEFSSWVALSYVWGVDHQRSNLDTLSYREGTKLSAKLPGTIRDAICVTLKLGHRYLWVDEFCIDQTDEAHRQGQIEAMDQIYRGATLSIVAAAGSDKTYGLPGVGATRRKPRQIIRINDTIIIWNGPDPCQETKKSRWYSRAWTFQEGLLSRRLLIFTDHQMMFHCSVALWREGLGNPHPVLVGEKDFYSERRRLFPSVHLLKPSETSTWSFPSQFARFLELYSVRQSSREDDTLLAFAGVRSYIRRARPSTYTLQGLPYFLGSTKRTNAHPEPEAGLLGLIEDVTTAALAWHLLSPIEYPKHRLQFPSWTWARWPGKAMWFYDLLIGTAKSYIRQVQLEASSGIVVEPSVAWGRGHQDKVQEKLDVVTLIQFETHVVPTDSCASHGIPRYEDHGPAMGKWRFQYYDEEAVIENVRKGDWSCIVLCIGCFDDRTLDYYEIFGLVISWKPDGLSAERVDSFVIEFDGREGLGFQFPELDTWEWRRVRLV